MFHYMHFDVLMYDELTYEYYTLPNRQPGLSVRWVHKEQKLVHFHRHY